MQVEVVNIADVLNLSVMEALEVFDSIPRVKQVLQTLNDVGLGYVRLGQAATTLSGGEAQRVKLASELCKPGHSALGIIPQRGPRGVCVAFQDAL